MTDSAAVLSPPVSQRPILVDESDGRCDICAQHKTGKCDLCGSDYKSLSPSEMGANGYQSPKPNHFHLQMVAGVQGRSSVFGEVCIDCYRKLWTESYPNTKCQV